MFMRYLLRYTNHSVLPPFQKGGLINLENFGNFLGFRGPLKTRGPFFQVWDQ